jgi:glycosyltransferase involved in cell wall biosynthesis
MQAASGRKILQITAYPPPRSGWGVRVQFLKQHLESRGHVCVVLNTGPGRAIPSTEYETVLSVADYVAKVWRYSRAGFICHVHVNGKSPTGFGLTLVAECLNLLCGRRCFLTFHAGVDQKYFPRSRSPMLVPLFWVMFTLPRRIICNSEAVKEKIAEYGIPRDKIVAIPAFSRQYMQFTPVTLPGSLEAFYQQFTVLFSYAHMQAGFHPDVLVEAFHRVSQRHPNTGLVICGLMGHREEALWQDVQQRIARYDLAARICIVDDLDHDEFLTALTRSSMYLRTPPADGVASSVLEALALRVPVVGSDNGTRPAGVVTYQATSAEDLAAKIDRVLTSRSEVVASIPPVELPDTIEPEVQVLTT